MGFLVSIDNSRGSRLYNQFLLLFINKDYISFCARFTDTNELIITPEFAKGKKRLTFFAGREHFYIMY